MRPDAGGRGPRRSLCAMPIISAEQRTIASGAPHYAPGGLTVKVIPSDEGSLGRRRCRYDLVTSGAHIARMSGAVPRVLSRYQAHDNDAMRTCADAGHHRTSRVPGEIMKSETIAIHCGYEPDPTTKAVAVPIYQTVAYAFDSAAHGAALFNLEAEGHRYGRISNPTTDVLERRVAALEGGVEALCVSTGQAALNYAVTNVTDLGCNIVSVPQLYGTTHTLFSHVLPSQGINVRFAESDSA